MTGALMPNAAESCFLVPASGLIDFVVDSDFRSVQNTNTPQANPSPSQPASLPSQGISNASLLPLRHCRDFVRQSVFVASAR